MKKGAKALAVLLAVGAPGLVALSGCKGDSAGPQREPPPPAATVKPQACAGGGAELKDQETAKAFPRMHQSFCLDPNNVEKTYGEDAKEPLERICDIFDGECEIYKGLGVRRVAELRYVDGAGSPAIVDIHFSRFGSRNEAFAMFTKRVVGDGDPASPDTPKPVELQGRGALGRGIGYVWRGNYLAELTYSDESAAEATLDAAGQKTLAPLMKEIASRITGEANDLPSVAMLPKKDLVPLGVRYVTKDLLGIAGVGRGAFGYYKDGDKRFRFAAIDPLREGGPGQARLGGTQAHTVDEAKDILETLLRAPGAVKEKNVGEGGVRFMRKDPSIGDPAEGEWIFARQGAVVLGIGDEPRAFRAGASAAEVQKVSLSKEQKLERLKEALAAAK